MKSALHILFAVFICGKLFAQGIDVNADGFAAKGDTLEVVAQHPSTKNALALTVYDMEKISARDLGDILGKFSGIDVTTGGTKGNKELKIRGAAASGVTILSNGVPLNLGYYGKADFNDLPFHNLYSVSVIKSPPPARYGTGALSGIVELKKRLFAEKNTIDAFVEGGNGTFLRGSAFGNFKLNDALVLSSSLTYRRQTGTPLSADNSTFPEEDGLMPNSAFENSEGDFGISYSTERTTTDFKLNAYRGNREFAFQNRRFADIIRLSPSLGISRELTSKLHLDAKLFYDYYYDVFQEFNMYGNISMNSLLWCKTVGGDAKMELNLNNSKLYFGLRLKTDAIDKQPDTDEEKYSRSVQNHFLYAEYETKLMHNLTADAGIVLSMFANNGRGDSLTFSELNDNNSTQQYFHADPTASLKYSFSKNTHAYFAAGRYIKHPTIHELYSTSSGNASLEPEVANKLELGGKFTKELGFTYISTNIAYYYNFFENMIDRSSATGDVFENLESGDTRGIELSCDLLLHSFTANAGLATVHSTRPDMMNFAPEMKYNLAIGKTFSLASIDLELSVNSQYYYRRTCPDLTLSGQRQTLPDYALFGSTLRAHLFQRRLSVELLCQNLLDKYYFEEDDYPAPGRQFSCRVQWHL